MYVLIQDVEAPEGMLEHSCMGGILRLKHWHWVSWAAVFLEVPNGPVMGVADEILPNVSKDMIDTLLQTK